MKELLETIHACGAFGMTGVIWLIQLIVYPNFRFIPEDKWQEFHSHHTRWITPIVLPLMAAQICAAGLLMLKNLEPLYIALFTLAALTWISTFMIFVPLHTALGGNKSPELITKLVKWNWLRTTLWSLSSGIIVLESL